MQKDLRVFQYFKKGSLTRTALGLGMPGILQLLVMNLAQMVDNVMVGSLQEHAIAGVAITNQIFFIVLGTLGGIAAAGGIFIKFGQGNPKF